MREALLSRRSPCPAQAALRLPENGQEPTCLIESSRRGRSPFVNRREAGPLSCRAAGARSCRRGRENPKGEDARAAAGEAAGIGPGGVRVASIARRAISRPWRFVFARQRQAPVCADMLTTKPSARTVGGGTQRFAAPSRWADRPRCERLSRGESLTAGFQLDHAPGKEIESASLLRLVPTIDNGLSHHIPELRRQSVDR